MSIAKWTCVSRVPALARSSHCLVANGKKVFIYGGEFKPRMPVDSEEQLRGCMHSFDLAGENALWIVSTPDTKVHSRTTITTVPSPRVGATMVAVEDYAYLWGGRGGVDMNPLGGDETGIWITKLDDNSLIWKKLASNNSHDAPDPRSFHSMVATATDVFIHAGCPASGRLSTLHSFDPASQTWTRKCDAPPPARGGTALIYRTLNSKPSLLRFGGFAGYELGGSNDLDVYDIASDKWHTTKPSHDPEQGSPGARSVCGFVPYDNDAHPSAIAILFYGERDASTLGHAGAGTFWDDVWMLCSDTFQREFSWKKLRVDGDRPEARGWFAYSNIRNVNGTTGVVMHGGLLSTNARADDLWLLEVN